MTLLLNQHDTVMLASTIMGIAAFLLVSRVLLVVDRHVRTFAEEWEFEQVRRIKLRQGSSVYRMTEPLVDELADSAVMKLFKIERVQLSIGRGATQLPWKAKEFVAVSIIESLLLLLGILFFGSIVSSLVMCAAAGCVLSAVYLRSAIRALHRKAENRLEQITRRMPFGIDLIALMLHAGAGLDDALTTIVAESDDHPFGQEFKRVLEDLQHGRPLPDALDDMDGRLKCEDIREMVFSISKSRELGTPLADIFVNLADQMRLRKSQWAEAAAGKAQVQISFPNMLVMVACMLTICVPFFFSLVPGAN